MMVTECPLLVAILAVLLDALFIYYLLGVILEVVIGSTPLIMGAVFLARDVKRKSMRWWPITLLVGGTIILVFTWIFPIWLYFVFSSVFLGTTFIVAWGLLASAIIGSEIARKKRAEWEVFKKQTPPRGSITDPGAAKDLEISSPSSVGKAEE